MAPQKELFMKRVYVLILVAVLISLLTGCSGTKIVLRVGDPLPITLRNCPQGYQTTLYNDVVSITPNGAEFVGSGLLQVGDEFIRTVDCGAGDRNITFGKVLDISADTVTVLIYDNLEQR